MRRALRALIEAAPGFSVARDTPSLADVEALDGRQRPSVILLDLMAPNPRDGLALLAHLAGEGTHPIVAMSTRSGLRDAALQAGARGFLDKGETPDRILAALKRAAII
ncbi:MAG: response regulator [Chloroflexi bacterium]|nr:response regulator [Chloroflexota bacterium]